MEGEIFLDDLVMETIGLEILGSGPKDERSRLFLKEIGYEQKREYMFEALKQKLPEGSRLPDGIFFVFTPDEGFIYLGNENAWGPASQEIDFGKGSLQEALDAIGNLARRRRIEGCQTELKALFYSQESKLKFERLVQPHGFSIYADTGVAYIKGHGNIMCHWYHN